MDERYSRTVKMTGEEGLAKLRAAKVLIVGVGGVGSYAAEAVGRAGVGHITLMDGDSVQPSNLNRQLVALTSTLGRNKAEVMAERIKDIDPQTEVTAVARFYTEDDELDLTAYDWIIDAIDDVRHAEILRLRYVEGKRLEDIACIMRKRDGGMYNYEYIKRLHGYALAAFARKYLK
jgi:tRNA A37 threonylcarbamoyladenosine dehydratase